MEGKLPFASKLLYLAFLAILVPVYLEAYGPVNFLYFCDIALLLTGAALLREDRLLASVAAVGIVLPQLLWCLDFACGLLGWFPIGMTSYMFDASLPLHLRALSLFHGWLPLLLLWMVSRLGYDPRAFRYWWAIAWAAMLIAFFLVPATASDSFTPANVNYVYGLDGPQTWMPAGAWLALMLVAVPLVVTLPTHLALRRLWGTAGRVRRGGSSRVRHESDTSILGNSMGRLRGF